VALLPLQVDASVVHEVEMQMLSVVSVHPTSFSVALLQGVQAQAEPFQ
jgi:hypothetical protein